MNILIIGAGKVGLHLAKDMSDRNHTVRIIEIIPHICENAGKLKKVEAICGDGCDPMVLESAGIKVADVVAAVTGDDEDNLVIAQLSKMQPNRPKVVAVNNHPRNEWLFNKKWGIDASVKTTDVLACLIEKEMDKVQ